MRNWLTRVALLTLLAALALPLVATAQETTGTVTGVVHDESGGVLPGVTVTLKDLRTNRTYEFVTTETGVYTASLLPVGDYEIVFTLAGFQPFTVKGVRLSVNDRINIGGKLSVSGIAEVVEVTAKSSLIQATPAMQNLVGSTQVQELPLNNRNFVQLATLAPGVSSDLPDEVGIGLTSTVSISVNGARRNAVNWMVDGVSNVDVGSNITLLNTPTLESIEEFKLITNGYAAEWPRSGGGIVNVVTKSGTNRFRGSAYEFYRDDKLNANSFIRNKSTNPDIANNPPALDYNNFGYTIGGPIWPVKDKAFFFWSQEWRKITRAPASLTTQVPDPSWLTDPTNPNYVPPELRDPNAVKLLSAYPAPNLTGSGTTNYVLNQANINDTRQEVVRIDYDLSANWRLTGRYTHDLSETEEAGGLFFNLRLPDIATTLTEVPGQVFSASVKTIFSSTMLNEASVHRSSNVITSTNPDGTRNKRSDYGISIPELFPENANNLIPTIAISGLSSIGANQLYNIEYVNWSFTDNLTYQWGNHSFKFGTLLTWEQKNENAASVSQGSFSFVATTGGRNAFQSFLTGNADGACAACSYTEAERDINMQLRFNRWEFYGQDSWRVKPNFTLDFGARYSLYPPLTDENNLLVTFDPALYDPAQAPQFANAAGTLIDRTTGNLLVGIIQGGVNSPYGDGIYEYKKNGIQPRVGFTWDPWSTGITMFRGAYGLYYDQPLVGIFEQNSFTTPPIVNNISLTGVRLSNPGQGTSPTTGGVRAITASATDFDLPRTQQWNLTVARRLFGRSTLEVSYVGSRGDNLIRPTDINYPMPWDVVTLQDSVAGAVNPARPYRSYGAITFRETTAKSRYQGLLTAFRYDGGRSGTLTLNYTLSRNKTDSTNDRDAIDIPQNPQDPGADYADARTDRRHIFSASYIYELPFFRDSTNWLLSEVLGGWQFSGITYINSGQPVPRISVLTDNFRRGGFANLVGDIQEGLDPKATPTMWFNPAAFAPPAAGTFGNSGRAPFRQPGFNKWDFTFSKNFYPTEALRLQFRADFLNAFNQTNWASDPSANGLDNTCTTSTTSCTVTTDTFGQLIAVRAAREIQLGLKLYW